MAKLGMAHRKWTVLLVSGEDSPVRQFNVSKVHIRLAAGAAILGIALLGGLATVVGLGSSARIQARQLTQENEILAAELDGIRGQVANFEGTMADISEQDSRYRTLAGLGVIDAEVLQAGVGGPGGPILEGHPLWQADSVLSKKAYAVSYDLNALERRALLLSASLTEAADSLQAHQDLLESTPSILPAAGYVSSFFSRSRVHPIHNIPLPHEGIDLAAVHGTPIMSAAKGRVSFVGRRSGYGLMVEVDHGFGYVTRYGHASKILAREGQRVVRGEVIAQVGKTGLATSSHLHYEVRMHGVPQNPMNFVINGAVP